MTELIQKESTTIAPTLPKEFGEEFLQAKFKEVEDEVNAEVLEVETVEGRKRVKALAAKINKSKTVLDAPMRDHLRELKTLPKVLEGNARNSKLRFEKLRESVIGPLNQAQQCQDDLLNWLNGIPAVCNDQSATSEQVQGWIDEIGKIDQSIIWPELKKKFDVAIEAATTIATNTLERTKEREAQEAELEKLRAQQAEAVKQAEIKAIKDAAQENLIKQQEQARKDAEQEKINAKKREEAAVLLAQENERKRIEEENSEYERLAKARADDKAHRIKINRAALVVFVANGLSEDDAKKVITLIGKNQVPNIRIDY